MASLEDKCAALRARLLAPERKGGALLLIYPPEDELEFGQRYDDVLQEMRTKGLPITVLDFRTLVFDYLEGQGLLQQAFELDAADSRDLQQTVAGMLQPHLYALVCAAAAAAPQSILWCLHTAALYPWISLSALLEETENAVANTLVIPFPGTENGPALHFLGIKDGYNYRATRV